MKRIGLPYTVTAFVLVIFLALSACSDDSDGLREVTPLSQGASVEATPTATVEDIQVESPTLEPTATFDVSAVTDAPTDVPITSTLTLQPTEVAVEITPTPTPLQEDLEGGLSRAQAAATDTAYQPTAENPITFDSFPVALQFDEFYSGFDMRRGWQMSDKLVSLDGQQVVMEGYVAPPLKPRLDFFVLTQVQLAFCPFCSTDADWPDRIALVYLPEEDIISSEYPVRVTGRLEIGSSVDTETGMVSLVRLYLEELETIN